MTRLQGRFLAYGMCVALVAALVATAGAGCARGSESKVDFPRASDGKPDLSGVWQALSTAAWDLEDHTASDGVPAGQGVVDGGEIPYLPAALEQRQRNAVAGRTPDPVTTVTGDPLSMCYLPGVPRAIYLPYPFQIAQSDTALVMNFEFARASRVIPTGAPRDDEGVESWMGDPRGSWDGDTYVIDNINFNDRTWFDRAGNFHSDALHVVERLTPMGRDHVRYQATIEDPKVFSKPWTISMPLYRRIEPNVQVLEYHCLEFLEPKIYGPLGKQAAK